MIFLKFEGDFSFLVNLLKLISSFSARYLTVSLRGPVLNLTARRFSPSLMGWMDGMGWDGMDGTVIKSVL